MKLFFSLFRDAVDKEKFGVEVDYFVVRILRKGFFCSRFILELLAKNFSWKQKSVLKLCRLNKFNSKLASVKSKIILNSRHEHS